MAKKRGWTRGKSRCHLTGNDGGPVDGATHGRERVTEASAVIRAFNPYEGRYPNRLVITAEALSLAKRIRNEGIPVSVSGKPLDEVNYVARKGMEHFLSDPIFLEFVGVAKELAICLVAAWLYDLAQKRSDKRSILRNEKVVISISEDGRTLHYDSKGNAISEKKFKALVDLMQKRQKAYKRSVQESPPDPELPFPIYLEHSAKIVGWARLEEGDRGIKVAPAEILDKETRTRIKNGDLTGFSIAVLVLKAKCERCGKDYRTCEHGDATQANETVVHLTGLDLCECSVVKTPVNPKAIIEHPKEKPGP
jgi:hypothetical protein